MSEWGKPFSKHSLMLMSNMVIFNFTCKYGCVFNTRLDKRGIGLFSDTKTGSFYDHYFN